VSIRISRSINLALKRIISWVILPSAFSSPKVIRRPFNILKVLKLSSLLLVKLLTIRTSCLGHLYFFISFKVSISMTFTTCRIHISQ